MTMFFAQYCVVCLSLAWIAAGTSALVNCKFAVCTDYPLVRVENLNVCLPSFMF